MFVYLLWCYTFQFRFNCGTLFSVKQWFSQNQNKHSNNITQSKFLTILSIFVLLFCFLFLFLFFLFCFVLFSCFLLFSSSQEILTMRDFCRVMPNIITIFFVDEGTSYLELTSNGPPSSLLLLLLPPSLNEFESFSENYENGIF